MSYQNNSSPLLANPLTKEGVYDHLLEILSNVETWSIAPQSNGTRSPNPFRQNEQSTGQRLVDPFDDAVSLDGGLWLHSQAA